ncbi:unnamed protein product [Arctogadus glacialis]
MERAYLPRTSGYLDNDSSYCSCYTVKCHNTTQHNTNSVQWWPEGGGWLFRVEVDSEQVSLESFSEDSERLCGPESGRELVPPPRKVVTLLRQRLRNTSALSFCTRDPHGYGHVTSTRK